MKQYKDLDLKHLMEVCDIDFAHYTYEEGMCSCCYTPKNFDKKYWRNEEIRYDNDYSYILFKNSDNGSGVVYENDTIKYGVCVEWGLSNEQLDKVCAELQRQLGDEYFVKKPTCEYACIVIKEAM